MSSQATKKSNATAAADAAAFLTEAYTFSQGKSSTQTSGQIKSLSITSPGYSTAYSYTYDANGNILSVSDGTNTTTYTYDSQNQLIREENQQAGKIWVWTYDNAGNIQTKSEYNYTSGVTGTVDPIEYGYSETGWKDLLTSYDGTAVTYDGIGNPNALNGRSYTWEHGRELRQVTYGGATWTNTYDVNGLRTQRVNNSTGKTYSYVYNGSQLSRMTVGTNTLTFTYDASGTPVSVNFNGTTYYYVTNLQGDVTAILEGNGSSAAIYTYDAWGKPVAPSLNGDNLATLNPLRYRGYVYDVETGLYYVSSRYYDPELARFINADVLVSTGQGILGNNMFAYCLNNPIRRIDVLGNTSVDIFDNELDHTDDDKDINGGKTNSNGLGGSTKRIGGGHGNSVHKEHIEELMDAMVESGEYTTIYGNRSLNTAGLVGNQRPDVIAVRNDGGVEIWEFNSPSQALGTAGFYALQNKISIMFTANPSATYYTVIIW